jgi:glutathione S-transferase
MDPILLGLPYSPWSERARWALDVRKVRYQKRLYQPLIGEPELRWRLKKWIGPVSVPLLILPERVIGDSFDIARWADTQGSGPTLFPSGKEDEIKHWNDIAQRGLAAGRILSLHRVLQIEGALDEMTPKPLRFGAPSRFITKVGIERTIKKYSNEQPLSAQSDILVGALASLQAALGQNPKTILSGFSYADITTAQMLAFVTPPEGKYLKIAPHNREAFTDKDLSARFADLLAWRDNLYATHRDPA